METNELSPWPDRGTSQLQIVLLGGRNSGKSLVGNLLLGKEEFVTRERTSCSRRLGVVAGRWLTVVDTPGWWCDFSAQDTSELVKREIISSVSLCPPGPHVFLITVKASSAFSEKRRRAVEEHVALLGERVWGHCMVVFTSADGGARREPEEPAETGGEALRWLREKCSQRWHTVVLNDGSKVTELLEKIQNLIGENGNRVFEMQENILRAAVEEKKRVEQSARLRFLRMKKHRADMQKRSRPVTDIRIVLVGAKGSGKTSVLNTILGRDSQQPPRRTAQCVVGKRVVFGRQLTVVDTPGWWMNYFCEESTVFDRREMALGLSLCPPGPHVFLLVVRVDRAFTETYRRAAQEHLQLISEHIWSHVIVLFAFGDWLGGTTTEQYIESEGGPLHWLLERCGNRYHVLNNKTKGDGFQVRELIGKVEEMLTGGNSYQYYEIEKSVMEQLEAKMRVEKERAEERLKRKEKRRQMARSQLEKLSAPSEIRLVLVGGRKTGKSSCGNTILNREGFATNTQTTSCAEGWGEIRGKMVTVVDTPGCLPVTSDFIVTPSHCAVLLVVNMSSSFKDARRADLEKQLEAGGGEMWSRALVLFSHGDWLGGTSIEQRIESEGEPLQRLVEKCGNRYHILDNTQRRGGAQVKELMELLEEMLVEDRLEAPHREDHVWKSVDAAAEQEPETGTLSKKEINVSCDSSATTTSPSCSEGADSGGQMVAASAGRPGLTVLGWDNLLSLFTSMMSHRGRLRWTAAGQQRLTVNTPSWFPGGGSQSHPFSPTHPAVLFILPQIQNRMLREGNVLTVQSLCHPTLRERALRRLTESGGLQQLIEQWGDSSLEELEAFIDAYFEMVWEQTMGSCQPAESDCPVPELDAAVGEEQVLSSIDRKLTKLELLEEIRSDLAELRKSLEHSWRSIQELTDKSQQDPSNTQ